MLSTGAKVDEKPYASQLDSAPNDYRVNCNKKDGHTFSLSTLLPIFGEMINGRCEKPGPCPICNKRVTKYKPKQADLFRYIIKEEEGKENPNVEVMLSAMLLNLRFNAMQKSYSTVPTLFGIESSFTTFMENYFSMMFNNLGEGKKNGMVKFSIERITENSEARYELMFTFSNQTQKSLFEQKYIEHVQQMKRSDSVAEDGTYLYLRTRDFSIFCKALVCFTNDNKFDEKAQENLKEAFNILGINQ